MSDQGAMWHKGTKGVESANGLSYVQVYASTKGAEFKRGKFPWEKVKKQT